MSVTWLRVYSFLLPYHLIHNQFWFYKYIDSYYAYLICKPNAILQYRISYSRKACCFHVSCRISWKEERLNFLKIPLARLLLTILLLICFYSIPPTPLLPCHSLCNKSLKATLQIRDLQKCALCWKINVSSQLPFLSKLLYPILI